MKANRKLTQLAAEYRAQSVEPLMLQTTILLQREDINLKEIQRRCGVTTQTMRNWQKQKTRRPNSSTLRFVLQALGYKLTITR
jgi:transcriptional regulator with XRE-family HTH domain